MNYDPQKYEDKWAEKWVDTKLYKTEDKSNKPKKYVLVEFPYPSGEGLHMGHAFTMTGADIYARYSRMKGFNTLFPMGWDAFGLPTENYAIKNKLKPQVATQNNVNRFRKQMRQLGFSFDWDREVNTTDPDYYKWTQYIFLKLYEKGLAYKEKKPINWCPSCKIGLANEEVVDGNCERCGTPATKKELSQWMLKITAYAERLSDELELTKFPDHVASRQKNWIDKKEWIDITYDIEGIAEKVTIATTRPDTNYGATFIVLAPEHEIVTKIIQGVIKVDTDVNKIKDYVEKTLRKSELDRQMEVVGREKTGVFTGLYAINHLTKAKMPIWVTDFVLATVGTGAVVGVPGHDMRDFEFAQQFNIPIIRVVAGKDGDTSEITRKEQVQEEEGTMINSGILDGMEIHDAIEKIMSYIEKEGWGKRSIRFHLRDWLFSRQHYWGEPIPLVNCPKCGWVPVPEDQLPIKLPDVDHYEPTETGESPLATIEEWVNTKCPKCGGDAKRETDTMPNWAGSSWYYLRYTDPKNDTEIASKELLNYWQPVDIYVGGSEHTTLHLLYSRFWHKVLNDIGLVPGKEPYITRIEHGVLLGEDGKRMSKSRGNVIVPDDVVGRVGADVSRAYLMFLGPFDGTFPWNENTLMGVKRFIDRMYKFITENKNNFGEIDSEVVGKAINRSVKHVGEAIERFQFNTAIAKFMELQNLFEKEKASNISKDTINKYLQIMAPFIPFVTEELWCQLGNNDSIHINLWPEIDVNKTIDTEIDIPVQINGKMRGKIKISSNITEEELKQLIISDNQFNKYLENFEVKKFLYVKGRIVNIVL